MTDTPQKQNSIKELPYLDNFRYENIFNVYQNDKDQYYYNILSKVNFPADIEESYYTTYTVTSDLLPYTFISNKFYNTTLLWWLICSVNNISNPVHFPKAGTTLKIIKPAIVRSILQQMSVQK